MAIPSGNVKKDLSFTDDGVASIPYRFPETAYFGARLQRPFVSVPGTHSTVNPHTKDLDVDVRDDFFKWSASRFEPRRTRTDRNSLSDIG